jgi:hypothetical protein
MTTTADCSSSCANKRAIQDVRRLIGQLHELASRTACPGDDPNDPAWAEVREGLVRAIDHAFEIVDDPSVSLHGNLVVPYLATLRLMV